MSLVKKRLDKMFYSIPNENYYVVHIKKFNELNLFCKVFLNIICLNGGSSLDELLEKNPEIYLYIFRRTTMEYCIQISQSYVSVSGVEKRKSFTEFMDEFGYQYTNPITQL